MKVALVYDRINKWGGAERVLLSLHKIYPEAPIYTLVHNPGSSSWSSAIEIRPSFFNTVPFLRARHELLAPVAALGFESFNFDDFDVVISVTSADAKAIITKPHTLHICYCLTPTRYFWSGSSDYQNDPKLKLLPRAVMRHLCLADEVYSSRPDNYIAISEEVKNRIIKHYHRTADIIYPAIDDKFYSKPRSRLAPPEDYYLLVGRLVSYKKVDLAIAAFNKSGKTLYIIGTGRKESELKSMALPNIKFLGHVTDDELINYYANARALIFPQSEDFGLVPLEAQATGTPVIAYAKAGALETVVSDQSGVFFHEPTVASLTEAITKFESGRHLITSDKCIRNAKKFSESGFINNFSAKVDLLWSQYQKTFM